MSAQPSKLVRGLVIGKLTLCFPLGSHPKYGRYWVCRCSCGNYAKRTVASLGVAISKKSRSMCRECYLEYRRELLKTATGILDQYGMRGAKMRRALKNQWEEYNSLYSGVFDTRQENLLMHELVEEFGPVREWELENKNFSLDGIYEDEVKETMVIKYCDICGKKLDESNAYKNYAVGQVKKLTFPKNESRGEIVMRVMYRVDTRGDACHEICLDCIRNVVNNGEVCENEGY